MPERDKQGSVRVDMSERLTRTNLESIMNENLVSAVFDTHSEAERAVSDLRTAGFDDSAVSIIAQHDGENTATDGAGEDATADVVGKTALGAGAGTLLGIAALAIPGVGPFLAAGAIAGVAIPGAALTGAAVGAAAGGLAGLLTDHGVSEDDSAYYEDRINEGGVFVGVDTSNGRLTPEQASDILYRNGGHNTARARTTRAM